MRTLPAESELEALELRMLLEAVYQRYGYDFREYAEGSIRRRVWLCVRNEGLSSISEFQARILHNPDALGRFLHSISVHVTDMFRDAGFYRSLRETVIPMLRTYPFVRIWHAGCSTGQEVYSVAILLMEEGLFSKAKIYATDFSNGALETARKGIYPLASMQRFTQNYLAAGGKGDFSSYYTAKYDHAIFHASLRQNMVFAQHNLVSDGSFNEFNLILCRNVLIYFSGALQVKVHRLLYESLGLFGYLGLGNRETTRFNPVEDRYETVDERHKIYRKIR